VVYERGRQIGLSERIGFVLDVEPRLVFVEGLGEVVGTWEQVSRLQVAFLDRRKVLPSTEEADSLFDDRAEPEEADGLAELAEGAGRVEQSEPAELVEVELPEPVDVG
jgi:hypothetical protein